MLEERESGVVQAQQVWSPVYLDALILRDRNADGNNANGPNGDGLEQRHYVAQDANFNVTALIDGSTGAVAERYYYQAYGVPTVLDANLFRLPLAKASSPGDTYIKAVASTGQQATTTSATATYPQRWADGSTTIRLASRGASGI